MGGEKNTNFVVILLISKFCLLVVYQLQSLNFIHLLFFDDFYVILCDCCLCPMNNADLGTQLDTVAIRPNSSKIHKLL